jgi:hypothetical protein
MTGNDLASLSCPRRHRGRIPRRGLRMFSGRLRCRSGGCGGADSGTGTPRDRARSPDWAWPASQAIVSASLARVSLVMRSE